MPNNIAHTDEVIRRHRQGWPDGVDQISMRQIPALLQRIRELEAALEPFARVYEVNKHIDLPVVSVYKTDCQNAFNTLDPQQARPVVNRDTPSEELGLMGEVF